MPTIQKMPVEHREVALRDLAMFMRLPDGTEVVGARDVAWYRKQLVEGFFYRILFPVDWTFEDCVAFFEFVDVANKLGFL